MKICLIANLQVSDSKKNLELNKKCSELNAKSMAKTDKIIEEILAKNKAREEDNKNIAKMLKKYNEEEAQRASEKLEKFNKIINDNLDMPSEKSEIINKLIELYSLRQIYCLNKRDNNSKANGKIDNISIGSEIIELERKLISLPRKGSGMFALQKQFAKLLTFFNTITCWK